MLSMVTPPQVSVNAICIILLSKNPKQQDNIKCQLEIWIQRASEVFYTARTKNPGFCAAMWGYDRQL
jgi:hypothetical protein